MTIFEARLELLERIRLKEDSVLALRSIRFSRKGVARFDALDVADELATFANSRGGVCVLGVDEDSEERASVAGVLMCAEEPDRWLPGSRIEAVRYPGIRLHGA